VLAALSLAGCASTADPATERIAARLSAQSCIRVPPPPGERDVVRATTPEGTAPPVPGFSQEVVETARAIGVHDVLVRYAEATRTARTDVERTAALHERQRLSDRVLLALLDVQGVVAELQCERERGDRLEFLLTQRQAARERRLTLTSVISSGVAGIVGGAVGLAAGAAAIADGANVIGGAAEGGFGAAALFGDYGATMHTERNLLGEVWRGPEKPELTPAIVWRMLNAPARDERDERGDRDGDGDNRRGGRARAGRRPRRAARSRRAGSTRWALDPRAAGRAVAPRRRARRAGLRAASPSRDAALRPRRAFQGGGPAVARGAARFPAGARMADQHRPGADAARGDPAVGRTGALSARSPRRPAGACRPRYGSSTISPPGAAAREQQSTIRRRRSAARAPGRGGRPRGRVGAGAHAAQAVRALHVDPHAGAGERVGRRLVGRDLDASAARAEHQHERMALALGRLGHGEELAVQRLVGKAAPPSRVEARPP
jgi:hypothetical protein